MVTLENIQAKIANLQAQAEGIAAKRQTDVLEKIRGLMEKHGVTTADIDAHANGKKRGRKPGAKVAGKQGAVAAKYRDPKTGALWSGRGRSPAWIASVKDRSKFLIDVSEQPVASVSKAKDKASKRAIGPQPPMYADPRTGATWSGRGRAPAWIAKAKDRTKFLIAATTQATGKEPAAPTKKAARGTASKKVGPAKRSATQKIAGKRAPAAKKASTKAVAAKKLAGRRKAPSSSAASAVPRESSEAVAATSVE